VPGTLYVIATPLGNLEDLSPRALATLRSVALIACEDTRRTAKILARFGVATRTVSCHRFNEAQRIDPVLAVLRDGGDVALVSDGGTPALADPGAHLVHEAAREGITVTPVPGPSAPIALLSASGLPADRFVFEGFLPHRAGERRRRLRELSGETRTLVVFESPHRIREALEDIAAVLGDRPLVLGRELTKLHESILRGSARTILDQLGPGPVLGEISIVVAGADADAPPPDAAGDERSVRAREAWRAALEESGGDRRAALRSAARALAMKRPALYRLLEEIGEIEAGSEP
jgi:16S rRNA (cytidine1402-2'-O)-methyltransferase